MNTAASSRWVIFDADNTLWKLEPLYNTARTTMAAYVSGLCSASASQIEEYQQDRDKQLREHYGYSASRFARSFEDTVLHFVQTAEPEHVRHVRALAEGVFAAKAEIFSDVEIVLRSLYAEHWHLGLLTAGEKWVQDKRIAEFHLQEIFHAIDVVEQKNEEEFRRFCKRHKIDPDQCWVVGDSKRSDILPATRAGLKAILIPNENWAAVEAAIDIDEATYTAVRRIKDILGVLGVEEVDLTPAVQPEIECYGIFEGGGAKGLAHVGALKACEERKIKFRGVAGTSAGAIIAGFIAVGFKAEELFSPNQDSKKRVFDRDYISLLGRHEWHRAAGALQKIKHALEGLGRARVGNTPDSLATPFVNWPREKWRTIRMLASWIRLGSALRPLEPINAKLGYFSLSGFQNWYNEQLAIKIGRPGNTPIRFADVDFDLQIVSADVRHGRIVVHSKETCPDRLIAEAVAASVCLPIVFQPKDLIDTESTELHVDGGMLSNFPAWVFFDAAKSIHDQLPVIGFELIESTAGLSTEPELLPFLQAIFATAISGKKGLEIRGIQNMHFVRIPVSASTLQFDTTHERRIQTYEEGLQAATTFFPSCLQLVTQQQMAPFLHKAHGQLLSQIGRPVHLRLNVMDKNSLGRLAIRYRYNMDFDPDDRMDLPLEAGGAGQCFATRNPIAVDLYRAKREYSNFRMSKYEQALVRSTLRSLLSVPIFDPRSDSQSTGPSVMGVLNVDSDDLSVDNLMELQDTTVEICAMLSHVWLELAETGQARSHL